MRVFLLAFFLLVWYVNALIAQDSTQSILDSNSRAWLNADTVGLKAKKHSPTKATLYSLVIPGLGQVYNKQYWKVPIIFGIGGYLISQVVSNHYDWTQANRDLNIRSQNEIDPAYTKDPTKFTGEYDAYDKNDPNHNPGTRTFTDENLRSIRDGYRRERDFSVILTALVYSLNIVDATVFAHLREFKMSEKLAFRIDPQLKMVLGRGMPEAGLSCSLHFK